MDQCFYCQDTVTEEPAKHYVMFQNGNLEREELLCDQCYQSWLDGIKE